MRKMLLVSFLFLGLLTSVRLTFGPAADTARQALANKEGDHKSEEEAEEESEEEETPVEADMHEFMEYVFEPPYLRLKASLATAPEDKAVWKGIKSDSLILAEAGNLLLGRPPEGGEADWNAHAVKVRTVGGLLYTAAKKKDAIETRKQWEGLLESCNACHKQFADGEHMLQP